jgi:hypothetical protein
MQSWWRATRINFLAFSYAPNGTTVLPLTARSATDVDIGWKRKPGSHGVPQWGPAHGNAGARRSTGQPSRGPSGPAAINATVCTPTTVVRACVGRIGHAWRMDERPELDVSEIASAMRKQWETAEVRPERGLERVKALWNGDLCVEHWASLGSLHKVVVRAEDLRALAARDLGASPIGDRDPNAIVASWLQTMIEEELDSGGPSSRSFTFDLR